MMLRGDVRVAPSSDPGAYVLQSLAAVRRGLRSTGAQSLPACLQPTALVGPPITEGKPIPLLAHRGAPTAKTPD